MNRHIVIVGTLDTKGEEVGYLKSLIEGYGRSVLVVDVGTLDPPPIPPDISRVDVASAAGSRMSELEAKRDRPRAMEAMIRGASHILLGLEAKKQLGGVLSIGGGTGTHIGMGIMRSLRVGIPKLMVSTVASRDMSTLIGTKDITVMHSVPHILGLNAISRKILANAAAAISQMAVEPTRVTSDRPIIGLTSFGFITQGAMQAKAALESLGYEVAAFHANGTGGMAMEDLIEQGIISGVLDFALHEFSDSLYGGYCGDIGPGRLEAAGRLGLPQVIVPGGLDCIVLEFDSPDKMPNLVRGRKVFWYDFRSGVRTSKEDMSRLAQIIGDKINHSTGPTKVLIPMRGFSEADQAGQPLFEPETDMFFVEQLKSRVDGRIPIQLVDCHINDIQFTSLAAATLHEMMCLHKKIGEHLAY